ncbi:MAG: hypothetical protein AAGF47_00760 [Planctomycetota bacterium]
MACIVIGVPFTYYWLRLSDRWAAEDQKRFRIKPSEHVGERKVRVVKPDEGPDKAAEDGPDDAQGGRP